MHSDPATDSPGGHRVFVALGSNVGDRMHNLEEAVRRLSLAFEPGSLRSSLVYETPPIGPVGSNPFLNAVIEGRTDVPPDELLRLMQHVEVALGRRLPREGPRTIDLDLLFYDDLIMEKPGLTVPHPRLHERVFVLRPMADLDASFRHPRLARTVDELLAKLDIESGILGVVARSIPMT